MHYLFILEILPWKFDINFLLQLQWKFEHLLIYLAVEFYILITNFKTT